MSGDPEQEYFADGLTEDIITASAAWHWVPVIARHSTFAYKNTSKPMRQVAQELDAGYLVEGSVRKSGERVRITAQLIDATTDHHIWARRYDRDLRDIFALQDEITESIVTSIEPELQRFEQKRALRKRPENLDAWDYTLRAQSRVNEFTKDFLPPNAILIGKLDEWFVMRFSVLVVELMSECALCVIVVVIEKILRTQV